MSETAFIIAEVIIGIALLGLVSAIITAIMVRILPRGRTRAEEVLDERYARGELSRDQYEQMRRDMSGAGRAEQRMAATAPG